jgi:hypothetical protein
MPGYLVCPAQITNVDPLLAAAVVTTRLLQHVAAPRNTRKAQATLQHIQQRTLRKSHATRHSP